MLKKTIRFGVVGLTSIATAGIGLTGVASASSISNTGPGSYNAIYSGYSGGHSWGSYSGSGHSSDNHSDDNDWKDCYDHSSNKSSWYMKKSSYNKDKKDNKQKNHDNKSWDNDYDKNKWDHKDKSWGNNGGYGGGSNQSNYDVNSSNSTDVDVNTTQNASSGNVNVSKNTSSGNVQSGDAENTADTWVEVTNVNNTPALPQNNGGMSGNSLNNTGPHSDNSYRQNSRMNVDLNSSNETNVSTSTTQNASSGDVNADRNTHVGNVRSGNASNSASTSVVISNSNN